MEALRSRLRRLLVVGGFLAALTTPAHGQGDPVAELIPWLLREKDGLREIPFGSVIFAATGKRVLGLDPKSPADQKIIERLSVVLNEVREQANAPDSPVQKVGRINEASSHLENLLREQLGKTAGFSCDFPKTADGQVQRSGYPDLRLVDTGSNRVFYLDPKLYAAGSRDSSFRTFYFEPKIATNKVGEDAVHLLVGFEHTPKSSGRWTFTRWDLVDLSHFKVRLKAEFQGSNRDIYRREAIIATSAN
jgi:hypothetical protein